MLPRAVLPAVPFLLLVAVAVAAQEPPATQTASEAAAAVDALVARLDGPDANARRIAAVRVKNVDGRHYDAIERAAGRADLGADARAALRAALPPVGHRARAMRMAEQVAAYELKSTREAYARAGENDPRWDAAVDEALALFGAPRAGEEHAGRLVAAFKKAVDAGCTDPLVRYLYARTEWIAGTGDRDAVLARHRAAAVALSKSAHPAAWTCRAAVRYMEQSGVVEPEILDTAIRTLPEALSETGRSNDDVRALVDLLDRILTKEADAQRAFDQIYPVYAKARPAGDPHPHAYEGFRHIAAAWEARGSDIAARVPPQAWGLFYERLAVARAALEKAWAADPQDPSAPTDMIRVLMGEGGDNKGEMEMWFRRAMAINPNNRNACSYKLRYLYPRWHGSHAEMLFFGRQCVATQDWWAPIPTVLVEAHEAVAKEVSDPKAYYASPEVWADIESVYRPFLEAFPEKPVAPAYRSALAKWACVCGQWDAAEKLFAEIGDSPHPGVFRSTAVYNYYRKKAQRKANRVQEASAAGAAR